MLRKLLTSWADKRIEQALQQSQGFDLSNPPVAANDSKPGRQRPVDAKLWLEDWTEKDDMRMAHNDHFWEGYGS